MVNYRPIYIRDIMRQLNTTYFQDKQITLDISLFIVGPEAAKVNLVVDRLGEKKMIHQCLKINGEKAEESMHYVYYTLQYGDYYSVESDETCEVLIWREIERDEK